MRSMTYWVVVLLVGCGTVAPVTPDGGLDGDAGVEVDAGVQVPDAGAADAGHAVDAGAPDAGGSFDAGPGDVGALDAGPEGGRPCSIANGGCDPLTACDDADGGVTCGACPSGYTGVGATGCVNIDECAPDGGASCGLRRCVDTAGSFQCGACLSGYVDDAGTCVDVNECALDAGVCHRLTTCTNTAGDFTCSACPGPYTTGNGKTGCVLRAPFITYRASTQRRSISLCTVAGQGLPVNYADADLIDVAVESSQARYDVTAVGLDGGTPRVVVTDFASGVVLSSSNTHFSGRGMIFDIDYGVNVTNVVSQTVGRAVVRLRYCREMYGAGCVELRDTIVFDTGSSISSVECDPPPVLDPASDLGQASDDDITADFTPTFTVASTATTVTWLRDDVVMATTPVVSGSASWTDDGTADAGMHGYSVRHGASGVPSANRWVLLTTAPPQAAQ